MKPATKGTIVAAVATAGLLTLAIISPKVQEPTPPPQMLTGTAYDPTVKVAWTFSTIRNHPMVGGTRADIPFADVRAGDAAKFTMVCGNPERACASGNVKLPAGPLGDFRVVAVMHEVTLVYPIGAYMEREAWHRSGAIPTWERRINAAGVSLLGRANEQVGVRVWEPRDAEILAEPSGRKRRVVR